jgi:hypothetical protein
VRARSGKRSKGRSGRGTEVTCPECGLDKDRFRGCCCFECTEAYLKYRETDPPLPYDEKAYLKWKRLYYKEGN